MNYNATVNKRPTGVGRKLTRRPMETPGLETTTPYTQYSPYPSNPPDAQQPQYDAYGQQPRGQYQQQQQFYHSNVPQQGQDFSYNSSVSQSSYVQRGPSFSMPMQSQILSDPLVANMAMQYGQALMGTGKKLVDEEIEKYVPVSRLKYYFAVDTSYVAKKLSILLFPYIHADWSVKYDQNEPIQPRYEINAPDLYIPTMAFLTYVLITGLILGTSQKFSPEKLSVQASSALAWSAFEVIIQLVTLYVMNINTNLKFMDLIAYSSYKYVGIIFVMLVKLFFGQTAYYVALLYACVSLAFFLMRTLKLQVLVEPVQSQDVYAMPHTSYHQTGVKRRRYFLLFVSLSQPFLMWWLSSNVL